MRSSASFLEEIKRAMSPQQWNVRCCGCEMDTWQQQGTKDCIKIIDDCICTRQLHCHSQIPCIYKLVGGMYSNSVALSGQHYCPEGTDPTPGLAFWHPSSKLPQLVILSVEGALHVTVHLSHEIALLSLTLSLLSVPSVKWFFFSESIWSVNRSGKGR